MDDHDDNKLDEIKRVGMHSENKDVWWVLDVLHSEMDGLFFKGEQLGLDYKITFDYCDDSARAEIVVSVK